eukprot:scaffold8059_cov315-Pinguiococcus_pyrenoidosus.AAC.9
MGAPVPAPRFQGFPGVLRPGRGGHRESLPGHLVLPRAAAELRHPSVPHDSPRALGASVASGAGAAASRAG